MHSITNFCEALNRAAERDGKRAAVQFKRKKKWHSMSWSEYTDQIRELAAGLLEQGIQPGDRVAILSATRLEWALCDLANFSVQAVTVPIYPTMTADELEYVLNHSEAKLLFIENASSYEIYDQVAARCPLLERVVVFDPSPNIEAISIADLMTDGRQKLTNHRSRLSALAKSVTAETPISIVYTSGTTGLPKGVLLTHEQGVSEVTDAFSYVGVESTDVSLSFLPYSHVLGRIEMWGHLVFGFTLAFAESIERVPGNLLEVKPTILVAVPRIFEKVYSKIHTRIETNLLQRKLFSWAVDIGRRVGALRLKHEAVPLSLIPEYGIANRFFLHKIREAFGGHLRFAISGGAPLNREIALFFHACGILILEGYGLTETTAAITVNTPYDYNFGFVGKPFGDVQIRLAEDGEILVRSKKVMKEYYKDEGATQEALKNGWFHTGDIGEFSETGRLRITDRKKDLIKTSGGKYVAPQKIIALLQSSPLISHVHIHGDQRKFIVALVTLDEAHVVQWAKARGISSENFETLTKHPSVVEAIRKVVAEANTRLASHETIKRFLILSKDFTVESGELTPSLKVRRKTVDGKFKRELDSLYL